jgi:hypothetical protein
VSGKCMLLSKGVFELVVNILESDGVSVCRCGE